MEEPKFEPVPEETAEAPAEPAALPAADEALIPRCPKSRPPRRKTPWSRSATCSSVPGQRSISSRPAS